MKKLRKKLFRLLFVSTAIISFCSCSATVEPQVAYNVQEININGHMYSPEFDGQDAFSLSQEVLLIGNPDISYVHNNKLYVFKDEDSKEKWFNEMDSMLEKAQAFWALTHAPVEEEKFEKISGSFMNAPSH